MTKVFFGTNKLKAVFAISGHANSKLINGSDLCCCAASMLCATLENYFADKRLNCLNIIKGDALFKLSFFKGGMGAVKAVEVMQAIFGGFEMLEKLYPENICVSRGETV